jgi:hypothetical protein
VAPLESRVVSQRSHNMTKGTELPGASTMKTTASILAVPFIPAFIPEKFINVGCVIVR